ncbi:hypothetical protein ACXX82_17580 [Glaciimonas sp. GNP009]
MSDIADRADYVIELAIRQSLAAARKNNVMVADGHCAYCDEPVALSRCFCGVDCRNDYDMEQAAFLRAGKPF